VNAPTDSLVGIKVWSSRDGERWDETRRREERKRKRKGKIIKKKEDKW